MRKEAQIMTGESLVIALTDESRKREDTEAGIHSDTGGRSSCMAQGPEGLTRRIHFTQHNSPLVCTAQVTGVPGQGGLSDLNGI